MARCLESVNSQAGGVGEVDIVVVDNDSPGEAASRIGVRHGARTIRLAENRGFSVGANLGASHAKGDVIAFLNDDAQAAPDWLASASSVLEDPTVAAVGPKIVLSGRYLEILLDDETWWAYGDPRPLGRRLVSARLGGRDVLPYLVGAGVHRLETDPDAPLHVRDEAGDEAGAEDGSEPESFTEGRAHRWRWTAGHNVPFYVPLPPGSGPVELRLNGAPIRPARVVDLLNSVGCYLREDGYVGDIGADVADDAEFDSWEERFGLTGAAFVTTREVWEKVGQFESRFFAYYEDADWCWRARLQGYRLLFDPTVAVRHERGATSGGVLSRRVHYLLERNRLLTLIRNAPTELAAREIWRKRRGGGTDGVAEVIPRFLPRALAERAALSRGWVLNPHEVAERWAGVDVPAHV